MKVKHYELDVNHAIALCHIIDEFDDFNQRLINTLENVKNKSSFVLALNGLAKKEFWISSKKATKFYQENKKIIDTINKYAGFSWFVSTGYNFAPDMELWAFMFKPRVNTVVYKRGTLYQYLLDNKEKIKEIIAVLEKIKALGFSKFELNPKMIFDDATYAVNKLLTDDYTIVYLDNLKFVPGCNPNLVKYKTTGSNYKIRIDRGFFRCSNYNSIVLNDLTFDANRLPDNVSAKDRWQEIIDLKKGHEQVNYDINTNINLYAGLEALNRVSENLYIVVNNFDDEYDKKKALESLENIRSELEKLQTESVKYTSHIIQNHEDVTEELLEQEKKAYIKRKNNNLL